ncbi:MAG: NAD-dependent epimerase/dehydratase family protein [Bacteroidota bacterium]
MKILIIGGTGTIGKEVASYFSTQHEVIIANRSSSNYAADVSDASSIERLLEKLGNAMLLSAQLAKPSGEILRT